ncbi:hypothetical protein I7I53_11291 [Histoplasma capsulatum var. duboisii H88]|uniref:Uncharacterized protein n=1 Tax=Ajellomyces capsulatus (strain H88) TaxID=544711 RepID=A0A8A1LFL3_AJEC8|nr:hypothetical protein I7I53_11291 [Histoplasma capsulatum var. duboisii H88]
MMAARRTYTSHKSTNICSCWWRGDIRYPGTRSEKRKGERRGSGCKYLSLQRSPKLRLSTTPKRVQGSYQSTCLALLRTTTPGARWIQISLEKQSMCRNILLCLTFIYLDHSLTVRRFGGPLIA